MAFVGLAGKAQAQIIWATPQVITSDSDVSTLGDYVDALQVSNATNRPSAQTVNGVLFKAPTLNDGTFTLSNVNPGFTASLSPAGATTAYDAILHGTGGVNGQTGGVNNSGSVSIGGLTMGDTYQIEVWSIGYPTTYTSPGGSAVNLPAGSSGYFDLGTFTAASSTQTFTFMSTANNSYGTLTDLSLRLVPEPSTYVMMICAGAGLAGFLRLRRRA